MAVRKFKPVTPGQRHKVAISFDTITTSRPEKSLLVPNHRSGGRNDTGKMTIANVGGGHKKKYRLIDFKRDKHNIPAKVASIDMQIEGFSYYTNSSSYPIYGGGTGPEFENQKQALVRGTDIIICTPGRLLAHLKFDYFDTNTINYLILDEADRMLDMGFYDDIIKIVNKLPKNRQTLLFSATMPNAIRKLAKSILFQPKEISLAISKPARGIKQSAYLTYDKQKVKLIRELLLQKKNEKQLEHVLIFASSIKSVKEIKRTLNKSGFRASEIHSGLDQNSREETLRNFKNKKIKVLVATDILSRGIDIKGIELVINYEVPFDAEDYIHRIGRTARADKTGEAITFINENQVKNFMNIEKLIEKDITKIPLPNGFEKGPIYKFLKKSKKRKFWKKNK